MAFRNNRIILFSKNVPALARFYQEVFGLKPKGIPDTSWTELSAGGVSLALHKGAPAPPSRGLPKVVFSCSDVAKTRQSLAKKGVSLDKLRIFGELQLCDGRDLEGNVFQLSNRP
jgi:hypothetical protein